MKNLFTLLLLAVALNLNAQQKTNEVEVPQASPLQKIEQRIGLTDIKIAYSRPQMNKRKVFGKLVPFDKVWRTGANENTLFTVSTPVTIKGKILEKGTYALYTKPMKNNWEVYFYKTITNWGTPKKWNESNIVLKLTVPVTQLKTTIEAFTISMDAIKKNSINIGLAWENTYVSIPIKIDVKTIALTKITKALEGPTANDYYLAADYYYERGNDINKAKTWIDMAVEKSKKKSFFLYNTKQALIYHKLGRKKEAIKMAEKALELSKKAETKWGININNKMLKEWKK